MLLCEGLILGGCCSSVQSVQGFRSVAMGVNALSFHFHVAFSIDLAGKCFPGKGKKFLHVFHHP